MNLAIFECQHDGGDIKIIRSQLKLVMKNFKFFKWVNFPKKISRTLAQPQDISDQNPSTSEPHGGCPSPWYPCHC